MPSTDTSARRPVRALLNPAHTRAVIALICLALLSAIAWHWWGSGTVTHPRSAAAVPATTVPGEAALQEEDMGGIGTTTASPSAAGQSQPGSGQLVPVYVTGEVHTPGLYQLADTSLVADAISAAGGLTDQADPACQNLARTITPGEHIHITAPGQAPPASAGSGAGAGGGTAAGEGRGEGGGLVNVNTADASQLQTLPGVGPALAQRIMEHREKNGPFTSVTDLDDVPGIGPGMMDKLRDRVSVQ
ncbi:MAG: ComEA family DNA-binding protein [Bowdeniella nasicola]|nr:ComEA family DNA-binding protein [Bowdeniella nasicola]